MLSLFNMYIVYILYSLKDKKLYIGCTSNIAERLIAHQSGKVIATRNRRPLELIGNEEYVDTGKTFNRERFLKSLWSGRFKKKLVKKYLAKKSSATSGL